VQGKEIHNAIYFLKGVNHERYYLNQPVTQEATFTPYPNCFFKKNSSDLSQKITQINFILK